MVASDVTFTAKDRQSTIGYPKWLLITALFLLPLRLGWFVVQSVEPPEPDVRVTTVEPQTVNPNKLKLYLFVSQESALCRKFVAMLQDNRALSGLLARNYNVITIDDTGSGSSTNEQLFTRYDITRLPSVVVALDDGTMLTEHSGSCSSRLLYQFLSDATMELDYGIGKQLMRDGKWADAVKAFRRYLQVTHESTGHRQWAEFLSVVCLMSMHKHEQAAEMETQAKQRLLPGTGLSNVYEYFDGLRTALRLLKAAGSSTELAVAHYAVAMKAFSSGDRIVAIKHLKWLVQNSDRKLPEYEFAKSMLQREYGIIIQPPADEDDADDP